MTACAAAEHLLRRTTGCPRCCLELFLEASCKSSEHLVTYRLLEQRCREWGINMWIATVDFAMAFDTIHHEAIWRASEIRIDTPYISLLKNFFADQRATVLTDKESDMFEIWRRGTKQGEPIILLFCSTVLQAASEDDLTCWGEKAWEDNDR